MTALDFSVYLHAVTIRWIRWYAWHCDWISCTVVLHMVTYGFSQWVGEGLLGGLQSAVLGGKWLSRE